MPDQREVIYSPSGVDCTAWPGPQVLPVPIQVDVDAPPPPAP
jgi:hypothetical protein